MTLATVNLQGILARGVAIISLAGLPLLSSMAQSPNAFGVPTEKISNPAANVVAAPGSRGQGWLGQGRSEVIARHGMVATSDPIAAQAGLEILRNGGNAIDAAVAAAAVLDVTSQNDTGIAGDLFALVWSAQDKKLYALNSAGWAPAGWTPEYFKETLGVERVPGNGVNAATVPGAISGYDALLNRFGTMGFEETFARAVQVADEGWGQAERRHQDISSVVEKLRGDADSAATFLNDGEVPLLYSIIRNPQLADALRLIQEQGRDAFYKGPIADAIVAKMYADGGDMDVATEPSITGGLDGGTIYLTTADRWGNMVSLIHSIFSVYGSGATIPPYGMMLHNRGVAFSLEEGHPNEVAPRKRPFHSIIAGFVLQNDEPLMTFGNMGGSVQPETHVQHMVNVIDNGMNVQMTTDAARFTHSQNSNTLSLEDNLYSLVGRALEAKGHNVRSVNGGRVGGYQGILFSKDSTLPEPVFGQQSIDQDHPVNGVYRAGSDHRKDGQAVGW